VTRDEFSRCVALIRAYWPHGTGTWTTEAVEAWESLLLDLDARQVAAAIQVLATEGREWPPPPGVVRQRACDLVSPLPSADEAWGEIRVQLARVGSSRGTQDWSSGVTVEPVWSHPLIGVVADRFGWDALCQSSNEMADRAHFLRVWEQVSGRERSAAALPPAARQALAAHGVEFPRLALPELL
jgi:hypothetical protein